MLVICIIVRYDVGGIAVPPVRRIRAHRSAEDRESGRAGECKSKNSLFHFELHPPKIDISPPFFPPGSVWACRSSSSFSLISSLILPSESVYKIFIIASCANFSCKSKRPAQLFIGAGRFSAIVRNKHFCAICRSDYLKYLTPFSKSFWSFSPSMFLATFGVTTRSLWPILPKTRPSGEVMPSIAITDALGLKWMS